MGSRPRRADAQRNYDLLLAAAARVFAERGADAPLDEVARRAGVGNATMYRHFPTRSDLLVAVYADEVAQLCAIGATLLSAESPGEALHEWLRRFMDHVISKRDLATAITDDIPATARRTGAADHEGGVARDGAAGRDVGTARDGAAGRDVGTARDGAAGPQRTALLAGWHESMLTTASSLLEAAKRAGAVRADLDVRDLLTLVKGITLAAADRAQAERLLSLIAWHRA
ncbi:TetR/AcrR family transcriptional regulator [Nonomuraea zeae]|uniref:TetR/AcrR family transcriptional regulator n=1 Tax=Nonomuraea zeae TaxID=1642303 RepID=UPI001981631C|nr:TetR/AcrR family transcriptional regulator [Nonomuraea zeae]